jgi:hypothetical protein
MLFGYPLAYPLEIVASQINIDGKRDTHGAFEHTIELVFSFQKLNVNDHKASFSVPRPQLLSYSTI